MRALFVEDDAATAKSVQLMLHSRGHQCETTALGEEAVELATRNTYDVILLDIMLPDIDGYEVLRRLHEAGISTPVLIQSGLVDRSEQLLGLGFGVDDFLVKPYAQSELEERIDNALNKANIGDIADVKSVSNNDVPAPRPAHDAAQSTKILRSGQIVFQNGNCVIDCLVLEISDEGAALKPTNLLECPKFFTLKINPGATHSCEVCWQYGDKMGVRFLDT